MLEIERATEPISGTIAEGSGAPVPFTGVMQLVASLDRLRGVGDETSASLPTESRVE